MDTVPFYTIVIYPGVGVNRIAAFTLQKCGLAGFRVHTDTPTLARSHSLEGEQASKLINKGEEAVLGTPTATLLGQPFIELAILFH